jgi:hypothetical protein
MAYSYDKSGVNPVNNTPYNGLPFEVMTSWNENLFDGGTGLHGGGDAGYLSLKRRNVATDVVLYKPYDNTLDTIVQLTAKFAETGKVVYEWTEGDEMLPDTAVGVATTNGVTVINGTTYTPAATGVFGVTADNAKIFRVGDRVRYHDENGNWSYAIITDIPTTSPNVLIVVASTDGSNLVEAASATATIQRLARSIGSDLDYVPQTRYNLPTMEFTFVDKQRYEDGITQRAINEAGASYFDYVADKEDKLYGELRRGRELSMLYGKRGKYQLSNGDWVYTSPGVYDSIKDFNLHVANDIRNATNFKRALNEFILLNMGAESGGPKIRTVFVDATFAWLLSEAFEDKQRFYGNEFIGGVRSMRYEHNLGVLDFVYLPILDYKHPIPGGSVKESTPRAVAMMLPVAECVERLTFTNEGPAQETFRLKGGDETMYMRVQTTEGTVLKLKQWCAVFEEGTIGG